MKWGFSRIGRHKPLYRPMEQTSTKSINQSETLQLPGEQRESDPCLAVREDVCRLDRNERITRGVIHDVNNHLSVVINYAYVLARYLRQDSQLSSYVQEMRKAAWRASKLSQQLSASRESNADEPRIKDINFVIHELAPLLRSIIGHSVHLEMILASDLWSVDIPLVQIEQILINLAVNGRDRMAGRGTLVIESANCEIKDNYPNRPSGILLGRYVRLSVSNSGHQTDIHESDSCVRDLCSQPDLHPLLSLGYGIIADTVKRCNGYFFQLSDDNSETTYTIYLPIFEEKAEDLEKRPACLRSSSPG
jgi:two-component system cell cycle sensor histidine kinase/response regulator CckA